jgi:hypothetical protein
MASPLPSGSQTRLRLIPRYLGPTRVSFASLVETSTSWEWNPPSDPLESNAMRAPSGDQDSATILSPTFLTLSVRSAVPSTFAITRRLSWLGKTLRMKASCLPSGENVAGESTS